MLYIVHVYTQEQMYSYMVYMHMYLKQLCMTFSFEWKCYVVFLQTLFLLEVIFMNKIALTETHIGGM